MKTEAKTLEPHSVDCDGFFELRATRLDVEAALGPDDLRHLQRLETVARVATCIGVATAWVPNPVSKAALALGRSTRWLLMHDVGHRGYDRVPGPYVQEGVLTRVRRKMLSVAEGRSSMKRSVDVGAAAPRARQAA